MKTAPEISPAFPARLPNSMQARFQAVSIPSTPGNTSNHVQEPTFPQKCPGYTATFRAASSHATNLNKTTYKDPEQIHKKTPHSRL